jgi:tRNA A-37 threonylcarbamoyl transferase component Bud32/predicted ATPase/RecA/RadA recombinase
MKCPNCQFENPKDTIFCGKCGTKFDAFEKAPESPTKTLEAPTGELTRGTIFASRFEIIETLGSGGRGRVYKVFDEKIKEEVALKLLNPEVAADQRTIERFSNELKLARKVSHRNVCRMYDLAEEDGTLYITMEYVPGEDLKSFIRRIGKLPEEKAISLAKQVCEGLAEAHRLGVVHRDLKPQNIMIDKEGNAHIMDFGIARSLETKGITEAGTIIGTPDYMSPEQVEGKEADQRSDIYSLGVILYEMVTGKVPFEGDTSLSIALKHKTEEPADPRALNAKVSDEINQVILRCMAKNREKRFQKAEELLSELSKIEKGAETAPVPGEALIPAFLLEAEKEVEEERPVFVAREQELSKLEEFLDSALSSRGRVVFVTGESGSGKTALVHEFARRAQETHSDLIVARGKCNAQTGIGDPYLPFIELLNLLTGDVEAKWTAGVLAREHAVRLWNLLPLSAQAVVDSGPDLIGTLLPGEAIVTRGEAFGPGLPDWVTRLKKLVERKSAVPVDPQLQQSNIFYQFTRVLQALAHQKPLLLILDDLQWVDAGSASLLFHLGRQIKSGRILIAGVFRPSEIALGRGGERHPLESILNEFKRDFGDLELEVGKTESREFVDAFLDTEPNKLSTSFRDMLYKQTKGHPLFTIELLRGMQDQGVLVKDKEGQWIEGPELNWDALPARVDAVIEERISRLTEKLRDVLSLASVEGEEFTAEVVARLKETEVRELVRLLSQELDKRHHLVSAKGIRQLDKHRLSLYLFQHIMFQRYIYNSLDEVERAHLHQEVGNVLEMLYGDQAEEIAVQLARHFNEAGIAPKAIQYLSKAGEKAVRLSANEEAIAHFNNALELLKTLPDTPERAQQEIGLLLALDTPLIATMGYGTPELGQALARARELCLQLGEAPQLFTALVLLMFFSGLQAEYHAALEMGEQVNRIAKQAKDPMLLSISDSVQAWPLLNVGEIVQARDYTEQAIAAYDPKKFSSVKYIYGQDTGVTALCVGSWATWFLGYPDRAQKLFKEMRDLAQKVDHPFTTAFALTFGCEFYWFLRDFQKVKKYTEPLVQLAAEKGFVYWEAHGLFYQGEAKTLEGEVEEGIAQMNQAIGACRATGTETCLTRLRARLAEACVKVGQIEQGLTAIAEGLEVRRKYDERYYESELIRLKGELLMMKGEAEAEVESCFRQAIEVARELQAKSLELRAVMSLSRLLQKQDKKEDARKMLAEIYGWFTEGFDTGDLKEAKSLLDELSN